MSASDAAGGAAGDSGAAGTGGARRITWPVPIGGSLAAAKPSERDRLSIEVGWLLLRPWRAHDAVFAFESCQDPDIQRWTTVPRPYEAHHATEFVAFARAQLLDGVGAHLCITDLNREENLGSIGVHWWTADEAELGYWIAPSARRRGVGALALAGLTQWCFTALGVARTIVRVSPGNAGSLAVAHASGYEIVGRQAGGCHDGDCVTDALVLHRERPR